MPNRRLFLASLAALPALSLSAGALRAGAHATPASGRFEGASGHITSGTATLSDGSPATVTLGADFAFDGAPDPKVALGRDGEVNRRFLGALASDTGAQSYPVPEGLDPAAFNEVWIWCERFDVPLGVARLSR